MGSHVLRCADMRGPLNQPARQHAVKHLWCLTVSNLPGALPTATACMLWTFAGSQAFVGPRHKQQGFQLPTDLAILIHHNLVTTGREDVLVVGLPIDAAMCVHTQDGLQVDAAMCVHFLPCIIQRNDLCPQRRCENPFHVLIEELQARQNRLRGNLQILAHAALMFESPELNAKVGVLCGGSPSDKVSPGLI